MNPLQEPEPELEPESDQGAEGEEEELRRKICASLMTQLVVDMASDDTIWRDQIINYTLMRCHSDAIKD